MMNFSETPEEWGEYKILSKKNVTPLSPKMKMEMRLWYLLIMLKFEKDKTNMNNTK